MQGSLSLVTPPSVEPVSVADAQAHMRLSSNDEVALIERLIEAARLEAEEFTRRQFVQATWDWSLDGFPVRRTWELPRAPLSSVTSITYLDADGNSQTFSSSLYTVQTFSGPHAAPGRVQRVATASYPTTYDQVGAVTVRFVAGYGGAASSVPAGIRQAILLLVAEMFERREEVTIGTIQSPNMMSAARLLWPFRLLEAS